MTADDQHDTGGNVLPPGLSLEQLEAALLQSGYPLQTAVSQLLRTKFHVLPEWGFHDRVSGTLRTLDMLALNPLVEVTSDESRVRPGLALLIECKRSDLPFVFFSEHDLPGLNSSEFPPVCGLLHDKITMTTDDDRSSWLFRPLHAFELDESPFIKNVEACSVFSKVVRKGSTVELSGTEAYSNIMMPLMSAVEHFVKVSNPPSTFHWFDAFLVVPIAIIDAPMVAFDATESEGRVRYTSWHRVFRNEPGEEARVWAHLGSTSAVDVVHRDYFDTYLTDHLMPFAQRFAELTVQHNHELATGKAFASGLGENSWTNIEQRMRPVEIRKGPPARLPPRKPKKSKSSEES